MWMKQKKTILGADQGNSLVATVFENAPAAPSAVNADVVKDATKATEGKGQKNGRTNVDATNAKQAPPMKKN